MSVKEKKKEVEYTKNALVFVEDIKVGELVSFFIARKKIFFWVISLSFLVGLLFAYTIRVEYQSKAKVLFEDNEFDASALGSLSGLASIAGINLSDGSSSKMSPAIFPEIVNSTPFILNLINEPIYFSNKNEQFTSLDYLKNKMKPTIWEYIFDYSVGLILELKESLSSSRIGQPSYESKLLYLSYEDQEVIEDFQERISIDLDLETGIITVAAKMPDPFASAKLADLLISSLEKEVTNYKLEKAKINLDFIQERFDEALIVYKDKQQKLATLADQNLNVSTSRANINLEMARNEMEVAFEVYKGLASQLEQSKISLKEDTPIFATIEPVRIPIEKESPNRLLIIFSFITLGSIGSIFYFLVIHYYSLVIKDLK